MTDNDRPPADWTDSARSGRIYPQEAYNLIERILAMSDGRIQVIVTKSGKKLRDVTVCRLGKVEVL